ncbi:hypothetical protein FVEN_g1562 [Fusarium venenatum]|uniref:Uncharacterized protein n=1 Tax=Fusarium venenatum TaxID=56646 RepID=A0A2L2T8S8_9HYPO|nr:uncharacterized protein FVRRES_13219 [Fusarium venenatum]KAG8360953.1 hypothetical protein FVEN_g1562 [Fusarium venenatum]KAH6979777.1 hypothetical protein EDB82DRAFT_478479 [Fusarium venenatum]CEI40666.1 unnamed protein product [Fusarium venenatum]
MTDAHGSTTPPPPSNIRTPPTPRLGYQDHWEPFSPRKSARISSKRTRTPSPGASDRQLRSPQTAKKSSKHLNAAIASPMTQKKRIPANDFVRRATENMHAETSRDGASRRTHERSSSSVIGAGGMLPTPSKTPQKPPTEKKTAHIKAVARNLFSSETDEAILTPKKRSAKKYSGISLESFAVEEIEEPIEIFTDTRDRVPVRDEREDNPFLSSENPFFSEAPHAGPSKRHDKRKVKVPGEGVKTVDELADRKDGMVYTFRGKRFFRKFTEHETEDLDERQTAEEDPEAHIHRPLTRASIKPRLLFQDVKTKEQVEEEEAVTDVEEEEAMTDVEENDEELACPATPSVKERESTPAPQFAPASPPSTRRVTRSANKLTESAPVVKRPSKRSPFDSWRRTKESAPKSPSRKRSGESIDTRETKRSRV